MTATVAELEHLQTACERALRALWDQATPCESYDREPGMYRMVDGGEHRLFLRRPGSFTASVSRAMEGPCKGQVALIFHDERRDRIVNIIFWTMLPPYLGRQGDEAHRYPFQPVVLRATRRLTEALRRNWSSN